MRNLFIPLFLCLSLLSVSCSNAQNESNAIDPTALFTLNNLQSVNLNYMYQGDAVKYGMKEKAMYSGDAAAVRAKKLLVPLQQIDTETAKLFQLIENLKLEVLKEMGVSTIADSEAGVVKIPYTAQDALKSSVFNFNKVSSSKSISVLNYSNEPVQKLVKALYEYRKMMCQTLVTTAIPFEAGTIYSFNDPDIHAFEQVDELKEVVQEAIENSTVSPDDQELLKVLYAQLSYSDQQLEQLFHTNMSWTSAMSLLLSLQNKVLEARSFCFSGIGSRISLAKELEFNQLTPMVNGPSAAKPGEKVFVEVALVGMNSDIQPVVEINGGGTVKEIRDGKAIIEVTVPNAAEIQLAGTIKIRNKSGLWIAHPWTKKIVIGE
jgi:hypothetical protein